MSKKIVIRIVIAVVILAVLIGGVLYVASNETLKNQLLSDLGLAPPEVVGLELSGFIEAKEIEVAAEMGGRIVEITVDEGDEVHEGDVLIRLDDSILQAQLNAARAQKEVAEAQLEQVLAGVRPEVIAQAEAGLAAAEAARDGARQAWLDARAMLENPQDINLQIAAANTQTQLAEAQVMAAQHQVNAAQYADDAYHSAVEDLNTAWDEQIRDLLLENLLWEVEGAPPPSNIFEVIAELHSPPPQPIYYTEENVDRFKPEIPLEGQLTGLYAVQARIGLEQARAGLEGAQQQLGQLYAIRSHPQAYQRQVDAAYSRYQQAIAAVGQARASLEALQAGATEEEIAAVEALVEQAQAAIDTLATQIEKMTITAPADGVVLERVVHPGELAVPGVTLLALADLDEVTLTVYVPEPQLDTVSLGQRVSVSVDSAPDRDFEGRIINIADEAEFTPRGVQTQEERVNLVFAVKIRIPNPQHILKPGMPADAILIEPEPNQEGED